MQLFLQVPLQATLLLFLKIKDFEKSLIAYMNSEHKDLMDKVSETGGYGDDVQNSFKEALDKFMETQTW